jgi:hypothetical protein
MKACPAGGSRYPDGGFGNAGYDGFWWTATMGAVDGADFRYMCCNYGDCIYLNEVCCNYDGIIALNTSGDEGFSVRCVADSP